EVDRFETLVNPGESIPPFITQLTGISDRMVANAPTFSDIAAKLYSFLDGAIMVAHNARFDHGMLKAEYKRLGATLRQRLLCTVRLSRLLYPQHARHNLDAIMSRHGLRTLARHRAMGDTQLLVDFLQAANLDLGEAAVEAGIRALIKEPSLPPWLDRDFLDRIPESPGVYLIYGETDLPIYIGKSVNLRARVLAHFSSDHASSKEMKIAQEARRVDWINTAGDIGASPLESQLIKQRMPTYNHFLRRTSKLYSLRLSAGLNDLPLVRVAREEDVQPEVFEHLYGLFRSRQTAMAVLHELSNTHGLCPRLLGLERGKGACFSSQLCRCNGVCSGKEHMQIHYLRLKTALLPLQLPAWPYKGRIGLREVNTENGLSQIHVFDHWRYQGAASDEAELEEILTSRTDAIEFDADVYKYLARKLAHVQPIQYPPSPIYSGKFRTSLFADAC
ncbi:MAG TPA: exonuclease domain-containing protein, partial [Methylophilaceae bacterium]|nr:exonuclease domain-containing protein [Methylophilaceae bacterium]